MLAGFNGTEWDWTGYITYLGVQLGLVIWVQTQLELHPQVRSFHPKMGWCLLKKEPGVAHSRLVEQLLELSGHPLGDFKVAPHWIQGPPWTHALLWGCWSWWSRGHASHVASVCFGALNSFKMDLSRSPSIRTPLSLQYKSISSILVWGTHEPISRFSIQLSLKVKLFLWLLCWHVQ